ncbi:lipid A biosynthesis acyltransferase [Caldimonas thermodepolymerans]|uniref:Lipid A biosynthesis acyltransferase n=1 Tax=Caldimonas thermodepolymerans TaxID=215580 RepID=A0A2S5T5I1_9BURK|nr:lipid A biosynthesis acyltransferase [Caldimonas thermodepolymerans]PPE70253.1 lipid A biosynthesis acyltransferase [Caldimonas thermodepolymerans]QPC32247.1 lipid A biosynthesis acyltransferase [Caldimonas thermodepolymerans]RDH98138.1 KDO2-lipid IV(A) lauroyltransferase [Caldimonas thermodepolymerans]
MGSRLLLALLWLLHWLPLPVLAALGRGLGRVLYPLAKSRRQIALRNLELCFPEKSPAEREALAREHFQWLTRSLLERPMLWYASEARLRRLIHVEGDVGFADRSDKPVMFLVPHFLALDVAGVAEQLYVQRPAASIYQTQSDKVFDAAVRRGRLRFGRATLFSRQESARPLMRCIRQGHAFFNLPDMDFGRQDSAFIPFFGVPASTLLAPSRMARALGMVVQPVVGEILPGGRGYRVRFLEPWEHFPTDDPQADALAMNRWIESEIRRNPAQYLWVHRRFKTRPKGEPSLYRKRAAR